LPILAQAGNTQATLFVSQQATDNASQGKKHNFDLNFGISIDEVFKIDTLELRIKSTLRVGTLFIYKLDMIYNRKQSIELQYNQSFRIGVIGKF